MVNKYCTQNDVSNAQILHTHCRFGYQYLLYILKFWSPVKVWTPTLFDNARTM